MRNTPRRRTVATCILVATAAAISAGCPTIHVQAGGAATCVPAILYSAGVVTCYLPAQIATAESRLSASPIDPVMAVRHVTHLRLSQMVTLALTSHSGQAVSSRVIALNYVFGPLAVFQRTQTIPDPPPPTPKFMVLSEMTGQSQRMRTDVTISRGIFTSNTGTNGQIVTQYGTWDLLARVPGRRLTVHVISNEALQTVIRVTAAMLQRSILCGAMQTTNGLEFVTCQYARVHNDAA